MEGGVTLSQSDVVDLFQMNWVWPLREPNPLPDRFSVTDGKGSVMSRSQTSPSHWVDKGLAHFARNLGLADSALPEIWRTNQIAYTC